MDTRVRSQGSPTPRHASYIKVAICKQIIATASARCFHLAATSAVRQEASTDVVGDLCAASCVLIGPLSVVRAYNYFQAHQLPSNFAVVLGGLANQQHNSLGFWCSPLCAPQATVAVETIAAAALRMRLRSHDLVRVSVNCSSWDLLGGRIQGARVEGRGWESPQGLTARVLDVSAGAKQCSLWALGCATVSPLCSHALHTDHHGHPYQPVCCCLATRRPACSPACVICRPKQYGCGPRPPSPVGLLP